MTIKYFFRPAEGRSTILILSERKSTGVVGHTQGRARINCHWISLITPKSDCPLFSALVKVRRCDAV